jgi:hypothetical protein
MQNIIFTLNETDDKTIDKSSAFATINDYLNFLDNYDNDDDDDNYDIDSLTVFYNKNYTLKGIVQILQYYGIYKVKNKLLKDELIQMLLFYETDPANKIIVGKRVRLWSNIHELKQDPYFSKYIIFNPFNI